MDLEKRLQLQRYYSEGLELLNKDSEESNSKMNIRIKVCKKFLDSFAILDNIGFDVRKK